MKSRKKLISFLLVLLLICAMALPVSAKTVIRGREYNGFTYSTSDTCNTRSFSCIIEGGSMQYTVCTNVTAYTDSIEQDTYYGSPNYMISSNSSSTPFAMSHIVCKYLLSGFWDTSENVRAS